MKYIVEVSGIRNVTCRRVIEAPDEMSALQALFDQGEKVEGYPEIGELISPEQINRKVVSATDDMVSLHLTVRELTLLRLACVGRLERLMAKAETSELVRSYEETKTLLDGKLRAARDVIWRKASVSEPSKEEER